MGDLGQVVWREAMVPEVAAARAFYGDLFGWTFSERRPDPGGTYAVIAVEGVEIGGLVSLPAGPHVSPHWKSYVAVADVDAAARRVTEAGGALVHGPAELPGLGRFAVIADPTGAIICLCRSQGGDREVPERPPVGTFCWETLVTSDVARALEFYGAALGWTRGPGPGAGTDVFLAGKAPVADVMAAAPGEPSRWTTYVVVAQLAAARDRALALGATVLVAERAMPKVGLMATLADPVGAVLSLFEPAGTP